MSNILIRSAIVLGLGVAPSALFAQSETAQPADNAASTIIMSQADSSSGADGGGGAGGEAGSEGSGGEGGEAGSNGSGGEGAGSDGSGGEGAGEGEAGGETDSDPGSNSDAEGTGTEGAGENEGTADRESGETAERGAEEANELGEVEKSDSGTEAAATSDVNVTVEQSTAIREIIRESNVQTLADIDFDISVGVAVPRTVEFYTLPPRIVEIVPAYEGYRYFVLSDGRIVIVEPETYEVVYVLT